MPRTPQTSLNRWKPGQPWRGSGTPNVTLDAAVSGANQNDPTQANTALHVGQTQILPGGVLSNVQVTPGAASNTVSIFQDGLLSSSGVPLVWTPTFKVPVSVSSQSVIALGVDADFISMPAGTVVNLVVQLNTGQGGSQLVPNIQASAQLLSGPIINGFNVIFARIFAFEPLELSTSAPIPFVTFTDAVVTWTQSSGSGFVVDARLALSGISR